MVVVGLIVVNLSFSSFRDCPSTDVDLEATEFEFDSVDFKNIIIRSYNI